LALFLFLDKYKIRWYSLALEGKIFLIALLKKTEEGENRWRN